MRTKKITFKVDEIKNRHLLSLYTRICNILAAAYPDRAYEYQQAAQEPYQMDGYPVSCMIRTYITDYYAVFKDHEDLIKQALHLIDGCYRLPLMTKEEPEKPAEDDNAAPMGVDSSGDES